MAIGTEIANLEGRALKLNNRVEEQNVLILELKERIAELEQIG